MEIGKPPGYCKWLRILGNCIKNKGLITMEQPLDSEGLIIPLENEMMAEWKWGKFLEYVIF